MILCVYLLCLIVGLFLYLISNIIIEEVSYLFRGIGTYFMLIGFSGFLLTYVLNCAVLMIK